MTEHSTQTQICPEGRADSERPVGGEESGQKCDFCGDRVSNVRRIALDSDYERLTTPHQVRYACSRCSDQKERQRLGLERG